MGPFWDFDFQKLRPYPTSQKALNPALFCLIFACVVRPSGRVASSESPFQFFVGLVQGHRRALLHHSGLVLEKRAFNT
jgi:hypothetical protein